MPFAVPMVWWEQKNHVDNYYFFLRKTAGVTAKTRHRNKYPEAESTIKPMPHIDELPVPVPPKD